MPTPISGMTGAAPAPTQTGDALGGLDGHAFLKLLVAQMRYQNPMSPSDPGAMLQQTSALRQVETLQQLAASQQQLSGMQEAAMAAGMVGKSVNAVDSNGAPLQGVVDSVRFTPEGPVLLIGGTVVPFVNTLEISAAGAPAPALPPPTDAPDTDPDTAQTV
jgi:flagellar basal-body rod modification protein FlgD